MGFAITIRHRQRVQFCPAMNFPREVFIGFYYGDILKIIGIGGLLARNRQYYGSYF